MVRASSAHRICTHRPSHNEIAYQKALNNLKKGVKDKLGEEFSPFKIHTYESTHGLKTLTGEYVKQETKKIAAQTDELPPGAKTYLKERWLEINTGLVSVSSMRDIFTLKKGTLAEDDAIKVLNSATGNSFKKNEERFTKGNLTGEPDIIYNIPPNSLGIIDIKVPKDWKTFRVYIQLSDRYHWQLVSYCYLTGATEGCINVVLMPTPEEMLEDFLGTMPEEEFNRFKESEETIKGLMPGQRIKTFYLDHNTLEEDIKFLKSRLEKSEEYFNSLTYDKCMNLNL